MSPRTDAVAEAGERRRATLVGIGAVLLWALLAPLGVVGGGVPPLLLTGLAFLVGGTVGLVVLLGRGARLRTCLRAPWPAAALGIGAFLGYHVVYFTALRRLPPVDALLIINTWPLLIVLLTTLLPGERLAPRHLLGATLGLAGTALIVLGAASGTTGQRDASGYALAGLAAIIWSSYSVLNRRLASGVPTDVVAGFCLVTGVLACAAQTLTGPLHLPTAGEWLVIVALGLGPVGAAFYCWDYGTKRGDLRVLGASAYAAPLLGAVFLVLLGHAEPSFRLAIAGALIIGGAAWASGDLWARPQATRGDKR